MKDIPDTYNQLFQLLRIALGTQQGLDGEVSANDWAALLEASKHQALLSLCFEAVSRLDASQMPPQQLLLKWMALSNKVHQRNIVLNRRCVELQQRLLADGFPHIAILKGQGNATMYPNPLSRQCGDIDVWVDASEQAATEYCARFNKPDFEIGFEHIKLEIFDDAEVELHFNLGGACGAIRKPLEQWFRTQLPNHLATVALPDGGAISVPDPFANIVHQASHIYHHFLAEGVGLRQIVDFFLLISKARTADVDFALLKKTLGKLHLLNITSAVFHVMKVVLNASDDMLPWKPSSGYGGFLLRRILEGGNFGWYSHEYIGPNVKTLHGMWLRFKLYADKINYLRYDPYISFSGVQRIARGVAKKTGQFFKGELK